MKLAALRRKRGPLPLYAWIALCAGVGALLYRRSRTNAGRLPASPSGASASAPPLWAPATDEAVVADAPHPVAASQPIDLPDETVVAAGIAQGATKIWGPPTPPPTQPPIPAPPQTPTLQIPPADPEDPEETVSRLAIEHAEPAERPADTEVAPADVGGTPISEATRGQDDLHDEVPHTPPAPAVAGALAQSPRISSQLRRIVFAYTINQLGTWFGYVALAISVYEHTHSAIAVAGLFLAARLLPALLVPAVVARVEASKRRSELSGLYVIEAVATAVLAVLIRHFFLAGVLIFVAIDGTAALAASALLRAAAARVGAQDGRQGLDPGSSPEEVEQASELGSRRAASLLNVAFSTTVAGGPAIAGVVVAAAGASTALVIDAVSFIACSMLLLDIRPHIEAIEDASVRARVATAWQHLRGVPALRTLLVTEALAVVFFASAEPVEVLFAKSTLHAGDGGFGVLVGVWGVGMVIGGLLFARAVKRPLGPLLTGGTLAIGISYVAMGASPTLGYACLAAVVGGVGNGVQWASLITAVQQMTPSALHGRLMAAVESMGSLCPAIGFVVGGAVTALASPRVALIVAGVAAALLTPAFARLSAQGLAPSALAKRSRGVESGSLAS